MDDASIASDSGDDTRARLLRAAADVFGEKGYSGAGVAEIARRAGLTTGAIYSQFADKAGLLFEAIDAVSTHEVRSLLQGARPHERATDILATVGSHLVESVESSGQALLLEAIVAARREPELAAMLLQRIEDQDGWLAKLVDEAKADGTVDPSLDSYAIVTLCHSIAMGFLLFRSLGRELPSSTAWRGVIDRLVVAAATTNPPQMEARDV
jgi:AcrR family transcriptional regulator